MQVIKLVFREMGTYNDMPMRTFTPDYTPALRNQLMEATMGGQHLNPNVLSGLAGQIIRPRAQVDGVAAIDNGWGERRFLFVMEVLVMKNSTAQTIMVITGHTDHADAGRMDPRNVTLDPNMKLYFDNCFEVRTIDILNRSGHERRANIYDNCQILNRRTRPEFNSRGGSNGTMTITPEDIFVSQATPPRFAGMAQAEGFRDMRSSFRGALKMSRRLNTQSSQYLSRTLTAAIGSLGGDDFLDDDADGMQAILQARGSVKEPLVSSNFVVQALQNDSNIMQDGFVTYRELCYATPDIDSRTDVIFPGRNQQMHSRGMTSAWGGADTTTIAATIISQTLPTYLMDHMYADIYFTCTNDTPGGMFFTHVGKLVPFIPETNVDTNYHRLINVIENQLMRDLVLNNQIMISVAVECSIYGETIIDISIDGEEEVRFNFPTFCESIVSPMLTDDQSVRDVLARDITDIVSNLTTAPDSAVPLNTKRGDTKKGGFF